MSRARHPRSSALAGAARQVDRGRVEHPVSPVAVPETPGLVGSRPTNADLRASVNGECLPAEGRHVRGTAAAPVLAETYDLDALYRERWR